MNNFYQEIAEKKEFNQYLVNILDTLRNDSRILDKKEIKTIKTNLEKSLPSCKDEAKYAEDLLQSTEKVQKIFLCENWEENQAIKQFADIILKTLRKKVPEEEKSRLKKLSRKIAKTTALIMGKDNSLEKRVKKLSKKKKNAKYIYKTISHFLTLAARDKVHAARPFIDTYIQNKNTLSEKQIKTINKQLHTIDFATQHSTQESKALKNTALKIVKIEKNAVEQLKTEFPTWVKTSKKLDKLVAIKSSGLSWDKRQQIIDSSDMINDISDDLDETSKKIHIFVAYDEKNTAQGIAIAKIGKQHLTLNWLATHPGNLGVLTDPEHQVKGVGTAIITHLAKLALNKNLKSIQLDCTDSALPWYKHLGFTSGTKKYLQLDTQAMQKLVNK